MRAMNPIDIKIGDTDYKALPLNEYNELTADKPKKRKYVTRGDRDRERFKGCYTKNIILD